MKKALFTCAIIISLFSCKSDKKGIEQFSWLTGKWAGTDDDTDFFEEWETIKGTSMNGRGGAIVGPDTVFSERIKMEQRGDDIFYTPSVSENGGAVDFKFTGLKNDSIIFENPAHDFPQRIVYFRQSDEKLYACIDGLENGKYNRLEFFYTKGK